MFCSNCGAEVTETAAFCRKCGAALRAPAPPPQAEQPAAQQAPEQTVTQAQPPRPAMTQQAGAPVARRPFGGLQPVQPVVGIVVIIGAAMAFIGSLVPWIDIQGRTGNGFDIGYITDSSGGGKDGWLILLLGLAAGALALHYFRLKNPLLSLGSLVLGAAATLVAGYNFAKVYADLNDLCGSACSPSSYISYGLYLAFFGGLIAAGASFIGLRREQRT
jgi:hypothetical protein